MSHILQQRRFGTWGKILYWYTVETEFAFHNLQYSLEYKLIASMVKHGLLNMQCFRCMTASCERWTKRDERCPVSVSSPGFPLRAFTILCITCMREGTMSQGTRGVIITSISREKRRRFDIIMTLLLRHVSAGMATDTLAQCATKPSKIMRDTHVLVLYEGGFKYLCVELLQM